ncbi:major facilitator superfamily domain-containing protein 8-like [Hetaerina americana]|uniref:major facilitator superfamily domain-containing protein 8-like n=1 Tax=Hetaerina americana TaxID=62018 RepID=UPI003A7F4BB7
MAQEKELPPLPRMCELNTPDVLTQAVIFPTAWDYLQSLGVEDEYMLGITVSAYSLSGAFAGILGGYLADMYPEKTRLFCALCSIVMVGGNIQYTIGQYTWNVVGSRLICGLGTAAGATLLAYVCRVTTNKERTAILSICNAARQVGVLVGPAFQALLTKVNLQIGPIMVNHTNAAGLLMALLWVFGFLPLLLFLGHFDYTAHPLSEYEDLPCNEDASKPFSGNGTLTMSSLFHHSMVKKDPIQISDFSPWSDDSLKSKRRQISRSESETVTNPQDEDMKESDTTSQTLLSDTVVSLLGSAFTLFFCQILVETIIPVFMKGAWGFGDIGTSMAYLIGGMQCLFLFGILIPVSKVISDTVLHLIGLILLILGMGVLAVVLPIIEKGSHFWYFAGGCFIVGLAYPIASVANASLLSKALSREIQGVGQGLRRFATYLGLILGPLWAGSSVRQPELLMGVSLLLIVIHLLMFLQTMKKLITIERFLTATSSTNRSIDSIECAGRN